MILSNVLTFGKFSVSRKPIMNGGAIRPVGLLLCELNSPLRPRRDPRGNQQRGGGENKAGKVYPAVPSSPQTDSPGRLRMEYSLHGSWRTPLLVSGA